MTEGIMHGNRYITNLRPITESVVASGLYPSPMLHLRADTGKINKINSYYRKMRLDLGSGDSLLYHGH